MGGTTGFHPTVAETPEHTKLKDARRKRRERQGEQRVNRLKLADKKDANGDPIPLPHPRETLQSELRLTLKEAFGVYLMEYVMTGKSSYIADAVALMEEYPALKTFVRETSQKALPKQAFSVFSAREHFDEEVGSVAYRSGEHARSWYLTPHHAKDNTKHFENHMVMEAKITPDKVLIYVPAFTNLMEKLVFDGKIEEPMENVVRKARSKNELILPPSVDSGLIVEVT